VLEPELPEPWPVPAGVGVPGALEAPADGRGVFGAPELGLPDVVVLLVAARELGGVLVVLPEPLDPAAELPAAWAEG